MISEKFSWGMGVHFGWAEFTHHCGTVKSCFNGLHYIMVLHTSLQELRQNINQEAEPTKDTPYLPLAVQLWGVFHEYFGEKLTASHCILDLDKSRVHSFPQAIIRWFIARLQYLKCVSNGDTAVLL